MINNPACTSFKELLIKT